ncbi:MAG: DUF4260 domain-containing protein [Candidatus Dojkabacteria bacterium]
MKILLKIEEAAQFVLALYLFSLLPYSWLTFVLLLLTPDIGMIGYLFNPKVGSITYNLTHHKAIAIGLYLLGLVSGINIISLAGIIIFAHSSSDRVLGYGLKYPDAFKLTHLGFIGRSDVKS